MNITLAYSRSKLFDDSPFFQKWLEFGGVTLRGYLLLVE